MIKSFRTTFSVVAVLIAVVPAAALSIQNVNAAYFQAGENAKREIHILADTASARAERVIERAKVQALALSTDSDVRRGVKSILFLERSDSRLATFLKENPIVSGVWLGDQDGAMITAAPEALHETAPPMEVITRVKDLVTLANKDRATTFSFAAYPINKPTSIYFSTPVSGLLNKQGGVLIAALSIDAIASEARSGLKDDIILELTIGAQDSHPTTAIPDKAVQFATGSTTLLLRQADGTIDLHAQFSVLEPSDQRNAPIRQQMQRTILTLLLLLALIGGLAFTFGQILLRPLDSIARQARSIGAGNYSQPVTAKGFSEFRAVSATLVKMGMQIERNIEAEKGHLEAELNALRSQMSPHFLFNTLNGIATTISLDPAKAASMLEKLSDLYRKILESTRTSTSPLDHELAIAKLYLELETMRFGKRLTWNIASHVDLHAPVHKLCALPGMILQTLVENAVKHGIGKARAGGAVFLDVYCNDSGVQPYRVTVRNTGALFKENPAGPIEPPKGVGLENTKKRLLLLYGDSCDFRIGMNTNSETEVSFNFGSAAT